MTGDLLHWALAHGAPPELAAALVERSTAPLPPGRDALLRAVAACACEAIERGDYRLDVAARMALGIVAVLPMGAMTRPVAERPMVSSRLLARRWR